MGVEVSVGSRGSGGVAGLTRHVSEVDGIRGILSLLVFATHVFGQPMFWATGAMEFFFVISGYFITRILFGAPRHDAAFFKTYAIRRALRVWPMYYLALALYLVLCAVLFPHVERPAHADFEVGWSPEVAPALISALFLQNLDGLFGPAAVGYPWLFRHSWSIAIEEQFYILWPLVFLVLSRAGRGVRVFAAAGAIALAVIFRCASYMELGHAGMWMLPARLDSFGLGIVLAYLVRAAGSDPLLQRRLAIGLRGAAALGLLLLSPYLAQGFGLTTRTLPPVLAWTLFYPTLGFAILAFGAIGLTVTNAGARALGWLRLRPLVYLGNLSYGTYMLHPLALLLVTIVLEQAGWFSLPAQAAIGLALSLGAAHLAYRYVEGRATSLRERLPYARAPQPPAPAGGDWNVSAAAHARR